MSAPNRNQTMKLRIGKEIPGRERRYRLVSNKSTNGNIGLTKRKGRQRKLPGDVFSHSQEKSSTTEIMVIPPPITPPRNQYGQCFQNIVFQFYHPQGNIVIHRINKKTQDFASWVVLLGWRIKPSPNIEWHGTTEIGASSLPRGIKRYGLMIGPGR